MCAGHVLYASKVTGALVRSGQLIHNAVHSSGGRGYAAGERRTGRRWLPV